MSWLEAHREFIEACRSGIPPVETHGEKPCARCKEVKPLALFYRVSANKDGRDYVCAACVNARRKQKPKTPPVAASGVSLSRKDK